MARIRSIHPDALKSDKLAHASAEAERCYWRLQPLCDDEGRAEDDPVILAAEAFKKNEEVTGAVMDGWLMELDRLGLIARYEVEGRHFLEVTQWHDYQKPQKRTESSIPPRFGGSHETNGSTPLPLRNHSLLGVGVGDGEGEGVTTRATTTPTPVQTEEERFEEFWAIYPRKQAKGQARRAWLTAIKKCQASHLIEAARVYAAARAGKDQKYTAHPSTWLNGERWLVEAPQNSVPERFEAIAAFVARDPNDGEECYRPMARVRVKGELL